MAADTPAAKDARDNGTVHVPAFDLPESSLPSDETRAALKHGRTLQEESMAAYNSCPPMEKAARAEMPAIRTCQAEAFYKTSSYKALRDRYDVVMTPGEIGGVYTEVFVPRAGIAQKNEKRVLVNVHGGEFFSGSRTTSHLESIPIASVGKIKVVSIFRPEGNPCADRPEGNPARMARDRSSLAQRPDLLETLNKAPLIEQMWLLSELHGSTLAPVGAEASPLLQLSGFPLEYDVIQIFSRDRGSRSADLSLAVSRSGSALSSWVSRKFDFECLPTHEITLSVGDADGAGCMAALTIRDAQGHVYPPQAMRLAPDMFFQSHIYRADAETIRLPDGNNLIESRRGPEYLKGVQKVTIAGRGGSIEVSLRRWIVSFR